MEITPVTRYPFKGKEYKTKQDLQNAIHDLIGFEVLDKINRVAPPQRHKDFVKILEVICSPDVRKVLLECLNVNIIEEDYEQRETVTNILDYKE